MIKILGQCSTQSDSYALSSPSPSSLDAFATESPRGLNGLLVKSLMADPASTMRDGARPLKRHLEG
jgi:hypothetical protein